MPSRARFPNLQFAGFLVPKGVSFSPFSVRGYRGSRGTKAFLPVGTRLPRCLSSLKKANLLRRLARRSLDFIKPVSNRSEEIRRLLNDNGVETEKPAEYFSQSSGRRGSQPAPESILTTPDGERFSHARFVHIGYALGSRKGTELFKQAPDEYLKAIRDAVAKMHSLGVTHNHLHVGNIALRPGNKVVILDLGRATRADFRKMSRKQAFDKFLGEGHDFASSFLAWCEYAYDWKLDGNKDDWKTSMIRYFSGAYSPELLKKLRSR